MGCQSVFIAGTTERGVLYGVFAVLSKIGRGETIAALDEVQQPYAPIRWVNQWDNINGTVERGYGGPSIFFAEGKVRADLTRAGQYARLLASVGINGCTINNVNAAPQLLEDNFIAQISRIADVFRPWGVQLSLSLDLSSPKAMGDLDTFDPLDPRVAAWWHKKADEIYRYIPDFAGFVVKADSEGRLGPSTYGRTHADAANVIARALKSHGGVVFYRAFVYNHHLDWRDLKNDRAKAAYDNFHPLDGAFEGNAIVQIKNGPIDFQVREPVSPLFSGLRRTSQAIEMQITQEYTGQQKHLCFLVPMWNEVLDFDLRVDGNSSPVKDLVAARVFHRPLGGFAGVANVGMNANWLGSPLAMANLYGFARLAWNPNLTAASIIDEWTRLTFGNDPLVVQTITDLQLHSWHVYESYTGPLGVGLSPTSSEITTTPAPSLRKKTAGDSGTALIITESAWTVRLQLAPVLSGNIHWKFSRSTSRSPIAPTTCFCSFITCRIPTCCIPGSRSSNMFMTLTMTAQSTLVISRRSGNDSRDTSMKIATATSLRDSSTRPEKPFCGATRSAPGSIIYPGFRMKKPGLAPCLRTKLFGGLFLESADLR